MHFKHKPVTAACLILALASVSGLALASSHREAPFITTQPKVDGTDFYMFRSYEDIAADGTGGRSDFVTLIANYQPLQGAYGGPNYFSMDPNALYEIHIDNNGDSKEDITFQFRFNNKLKGVALDIGTSKVAIPLINFGGVSGLTDGNLNLNESYSVNVVRGNRRTGTSQAVSKTSGGTSFEKPTDYIGTKTFGNAAAYEAYAQKHVHSVSIPGCATPAKVFVGQRQEGFAVNLGTVFDLVNAPVSFLTNAANNDAAGNGGNHYIQKLNTTSISMEVHKSCLTAGSEPVIGGWTTASLRQSRLLNGAPPSGHQTTEKVGGAWVQVSRLGSPLVNELVIGLPDKDKFNASKPENDAANFLTYVTNPTLPKVLEIALPDLKGTSPTNLPRTDLVAAFLTGIAGVNQPANVKASEMLRLNTAIAPVQAAAQNRLGVAGNALAAGKDNAGFPNGRRPKDDVVDIALVAVMGGLCVLNGDTDGLKLNSVAGVPGVTSACKPSSVPLAASAASTTALVSLHDGVDQAKVPFLSRFPYLNTPNSGD